MALAKKHNLFVVEDAAQGVMSTYKGRALGTIGHIGCFSFHETKNYTAGGEGGATLINDKALIERAEIIREKGTNRSQFFRGQVDKYTWRDIGSSYLMSDLQAAYLWAQLEAADRINQQRLALWQNYYDALAPLAKMGVSSCRFPMAACRTRICFYIKLRDIDDRSALINFLKAEIMAVFHYIPLHGCPAGNTLVSSTVKIATPPKRAPAAPAAVLQPVARQSAYGNSSCKPPRCRIIQPRSFQLVAKPSFA